MNKNIKIPKLLFFICGLFFYGNFASAAALNLPKDSEGWTIFTPSDDSRIMYVSADGDDSTGTIYDDDDAALGGNPFNPSGTINSFATYAAAYAKVREGYPDWILFKRGDTFYQTAEYRVRRGRSLTEPTVLGSYGSSGPAPTIRTTYPGSPYTAVNLADNRASFIAISGINFYASSRDPDSPDFVSTVGGTGLSLYLSTNSGYPFSVEGVLIEGCGFRFYSNNMTFSSGNGYADGYTIRRSIITDSYGYGGHSQGIQGGISANFLVEENIFDHNGWYSFAGSGIYGEATIFNHNSYLSAKDGLTIRKNIFMRSSNMNNKFTAVSSSNAKPIVIENNLYIDGQQGIGIGNNNPGFPPIDNINIKGNVFTDIGKSNHLQGIAWVVDLGFDSTGSSVSNNLVINQRSSDVRNNFVFGIAGKQTNLSIRDNTTYNFQYGKGFFISNLGAQNSLDGTKINVNIHGNTFRTDVNAPYNVYLNSNGGSVDGINFATNTYYGDRSSADQFYDLNTHTSYSLDQWQALTGDNSSIEQVSFPDTTRSVETYMSSIGEIETLESFYAKCREQSRYNWDPKFTADAVNSWIKAGFATAVSRSDVDNSSTVTTTDALLTLRNSLGLSMNGTAWQASSTTGDVNCDGVSNSTDALLILRYSLGLGMSETGWCDD